MVEYSTERSNRFAPLLGLRVLDLGRVVAAPVATAALAALGAEVVRVEKPGGDLSWKLPPFVEEDGSETETVESGGIPLGHLRRSRGKRSVVIDLRTEEGKERLRDLIATSDVVVENFRPRALEDLGVSPEDMLERHERLIWCSISGYGSNGPWARRTAIDITVQAESGLLHRTGHPDGPSVRAGATIVDHLAANWAVSGVLTALLERERTGSGCRVDVSMLEAISAVMWDDALDAETGVEERTGNSDPRGGPHGVYPCSNGSVAVVVTSDAQWRTLLDEYLDAAHLTELDGRSRGERRSEIDAALTAWTATLEAEDAAERLSELGISAGVVRSPATTADHPQHGARGFLAPLLTAGGIPTGYLGPALPFQIDGFHPRPGPDVESLGASTDEILEGGWREGDPHQPDRIRTHPTGEST